MRHTLPNWSTERLQKQRFGDLTFLRVYDLLRPSSRKTKARKRKRRQDEDAEDEDEDSVFGSNSDLDGASG